MLPNRTPRGFFAHTRRVRQPIRFSGPAEGSILLNVSPILTMFLTASMGQEKLKLGSIFGAMLAFCGVILIMLPGIGSADQKLLGYFLMITAAAIWALSISIMKPLLQTYSPLRVMTLSMPGGFPVMLAYWLIRDGGRLPLAQITPLGWLLFGHVALLSGVLAFVMFYKGVRDIGAAGAALWMYFVPPLTAILQWWIFGKSLSLVQIAGLVVVIAGVATAQHFRAQAAIPAAPPEPA